MIKPKATIHFTGRGFLFAIASVPQCADLPTIDLAIRAAQEAGCEIVGFYQTTGGLEKLQEKRA